MTFNAVFPLFANVTQLDFAGPVTVLSRVPDTKIHVVTPDDAPVQTDCGFAISPTVTRQNCPDADFLCVPGGFGVADIVGDAGFMTFIRKQAEQAEYVTSVCTGLFVLGALRLLKGRRVTTHWAYTSLIPMCGATHEAGRVVMDGNLITGGGVTAGIDFGLACAARIAGDTAAKSIQLALEYDPAPPFDCGTPAKAGAAIVGPMSSQYEPAVARMKQALERVI